MVHSILRHKLSQNSLPNKLRPSKENQRQLRKAGAVLLCLVMVPHGHSRHRFVIKLHSLLMWHWLVGKLPGEHVQVVVGGRLPKSRLVHVILTHRSENRRHQRHCPIVRVRHRTAQDGNIGRHLNLLNGRHSRTRKSTSKSKNQNSSNKERDTPHRNKKADRVHLLQTIQPGKAK